MVPLWFRRETASIAVVIRLVYAGIVPCGIAEHGVTSLVDLGLPVTLADLDAALAATFDEVFGASRTLRPSAAA